MLDFQWTERRWCLDCGTEGILSGARSAIFIDDRWCFPFEGAAPVFSHAAWRDPIGAGTRRQWVAQDRVQGLAATLEVAVYDDLPLCRCRMHLTNVTDRPLRLGAVHILELTRAEGGQVHLPVPPAETSIFIDSGTGHSSGACSLTGLSPQYDEKWNQLCVGPSLARMKAVTGRDAIGEGDHASPSGLAVLADRADAAGAILIGFAPPLRTLNTILCRSNSAIEYLATASQLAGFELAPGATYASEELLLGFFADGLTALREYALVAARLRGITPRCDIPSGWISWYGYRLEVTEQAMLDNARIVAERFLPYGADVVQLDFGFEKDFVPNDSLHACPQRFAHGLPWLSDQLSSMGLRLGLWLCPVLTSSRYSLFADHPEYFVRDHSGAPLMFGKWTWGSREPMHVLDPTVPGAMDDPMRQIELMRKATGCRYWKMDFLACLMYILEQGCFADSKMIAGMEVYRTAVEALRRAAGTDYVYFCSNYGFGDFGVGDTTTTAADIGNPCFSTPRADDNMIYGLATFRQNATTIVSRHFLHRRLTNLNADTANLGPEGDDREARLRFSLVAFSGGQFFLGDDLTQYSEDRLAMAEKGMPVYGAAAIPLDLFSTPYPDHPRLWHLPVQTAWGSWDVFCLVNITEQTLRVRLPDSIAEPGDQWVFDFWARRVLGRLRDHMEYELQPIESRILCVRPAQTRPSLVATDMHFTQGGVEVTKHAWEESHHLLVLGLRRRAGASGNLWVHVPDGAVVDHPVHSEGATCEWVGLRDRDQDGALHHLFPGVAELSVHFQRPDASISLRFKPASKYQETSNDKT